MPYPDAFNCIRPLPPRLRYAELQPSVRFAPIEKMSAARRIPPAVGNRPADLSGIHTGEKLLSVAMPYPAAFG